MRIKVVHSINDLARDMDGIVRKALPDMIDLVDDTAEEGNRVARAQAVVTSRQHAKLYPYSFSVESDGVLARLYGPTKGGQGSLAPILENGSINNPPHNNLDHSVDYVRARFSKAAGKMMSGWFW